jgi:hypothetical protein
VLRVEDTIPSEVIACRLDDDPAFRLAFAHALHSLTKWEQ